MIRTRIDQLQEEEAVITGTIVNTNRAHDFAGKGNDGRPGRDGLSTAHVVDILHCVWSFKR